MSRRSAKSRRLRRRPSRIIPAVIVAAVLLAAAVLAVTAGVVRMSSGAWPSGLEPALTTAASTSWGDPILIGVLVAVTAVGLILLTAGVKPGPFAAASLQSPAGEQPADQVEYVISSRALAKLAAAQADTVDGVDSVSASATGRTVRLKVATTSEQTGMIRQQVRQAVSSALTLAGVQPVPRVLASVHTKEM